MNRHIICHIQILNVAHPGLHREGVTFIIEIIKTMKDISGLKACAGFQSQPDGEVAEGTDGIMGIEISDPTYGLSLATS